MLNQTILNYKIDSLIGEGGMGTVYLGTHVTLGRKAAIKVLLPELARNQQIKDRFINEARTLSKLNHQNIVTLYDFDDVNGNLLLVMEYVEGTPLDIVIEKITGPIPEPRCVNIFEQILAGFAYAHKKGIIHRDIKPSNIILQSDDTPKILDFGIAKIVEGDVRLTKTGTRMGSVVYMSPEQVLGKEVDYRSDIYSLGITLYEMLSGKLPYDTTTESEFEIQTKIVRELLRPISTINPNVSERLENIINTATAKEAQYRFQNCEEFKNALESTAYSSNINKTVINTPDYSKTVFQIPSDGSKTQIQYSRPTIQNRSSKTRLLVVAGVVLIALILIIALVSQNNREPIVEKKTNVISPSTDNQNQQQINTKPKTEEISETVENVRGFITDLGNRDFYSAYQRQKNKAWGDYSYFSSPRAFGGITKTTINEINKIDENSFEATVYVDYYSYDPANKDGQYKQEFTLNKIDGNWKIVKVKNIEVRQWKH